jgi:hypothetical protein
MAGGSGGTQNAFLRNHETFGFDFKRVARSYVLLTDVARLRRKKKQVNLITVDRTTTGL